MWGCRTPSTRACLRNTCLGKRPIARVSHCRVTEGDSRPSLLRFSSRLSPSALRTANGPAGTAPGRNVTLISRFLINTRSKLELEAFIESEHLAGNRQPLQLLGPKRKVSASITSFNSHSSDTRNPFADHQLPCRLPWRGSQTPHGSVELDLYEYTEHVVICPVLHASVLVHHVMSSISNPVQ